ncbi:SCAN domain-containing protein 3 [Acipenser ruthenus]|uniref:SCAN domain-containing protein 3 n=1 Tax=Acipenser ruthenus TaxID=7906 RepID=A0A444TXY3_ACIRT|nr:SCAN domain-containing protein 3 [Acipenser ruthenus]
MFSLLCEFLNFDEVEVDRLALCAVMGEHTDSLLYQFRTYFSDMVSTSERMWIANPFLQTDAELLEMTPREEDQFIELRNNTPMKCAHETTELWVHASDEFPALQVLLPFATNYLCERGFPGLTSIQIKHRSRMNVENDLRICLTEIPPQLDQLFALFSVVHRNICTNY